MTIEMDNKRAVELLKRIPIVAKSYNDGEPINDLAEAIIKGIMVLENEE